MLASILFLLASPLSGTSEASDRLTADQSLIQPYSLEGQQREPYSPPYFTKFLNGSKALVFMAGEHENEVDGSTHKMIARTIDEFQPQFIIVEGLKASYGVNPHGFRYTLEECRPGSKGVCNEISLAIAQAIQQSIPYRGAEPDDAAVKDEMLRRNRSLSDYLGIMIVRWAAIWHSWGVKDQEVPAQIDKFLLEQSGELQMPLQMNREEFYAWYRKTMGKEFDYNNIDDLAPLPAADATPIQNLAYEADILREICLQRAIENAVNEFDRVMVVYGSGHLIKHRQALEQMFGRHEDFKF